LKFSRCRYHYYFGGREKRYNRPYIIPYLPIYLIRKSRKLSMEKIVAYYSELSHAERVSFFLCPVWKYRIRLLWRCWRLRRGKDYYHTRRLQPVNYLLSNTNLNSYSLSLRIISTLSNIPQACSLRIHTLITSTFIQILIFGIFTSRYRCINNL